MSKKKLQPLETGPIVLDIENKAPDKVYSSFEDFVTRIDGRVTNKRTVVNLILAGALDELLENLTVKDKILKYLELKSQF